jgi:hypothetical protein
MIIRMKAKGRMANRNVSALKVDGNEFIGLLYTDLRTSDPRTKSISQRENQLQESNKTAEDALRDKTGWSIQKGKLVLIVEQPRGKVRQLIAIQITVKFE